MPKGSLRQTLKAGDLYFEPNKLNGLSAPFQTSITRFSALGRGKQGCGIVVEKGLWHKAQARACAQSSLRDLTADW